MSALWLLTGWMRHEGGGYSWAGNSATAIVYPSDGKWRWRVDGKGQGVTKRRVDAVRRIRKHCPWIPPIGKGAP